MRPVRGVRVRARRVHLHGLRAWQVAARGQEGLLPAGDQSHQVEQRVRDRPCCDLVPGYRGNYGGRVPPVPPQGHTCSEGVRPRTDHHPAGGGTRLLFEHVPPLGHAHHRHLHTAEVRCRSELQRGVRGAVDQDEQNREDLRLGVEDRGQAQVHQSRVPGVHRGSSHRVTGEYLYGESGFPIIHGIMASRICMGVWGFGKIGKFVIERFHGIWNGLENLWFNYLGFKVNFLRFFSSQKKKKNVISDRADAGVDDHRATGHEILLSGS